MAAEAGSRTHVHACLFTQKARQKPKETAFTENTQLGSRKRPNDFVLGSSEKNSHSF